MNSRGFWRLGWLTQVMAFVILLVGVVSAHAWNIEGTVVNSSGKTGRGSTSASTASTVVTHYMG